MSLKRTRPNPRANLTPKKAVRRFCRNCVENSRWIEDCGGDKVLNTIDPVSKEFSARPCSFYKYRMGVGRPSVRLIRKECLYCMGGSHKAVRDCGLTDCPLHPFRMGTNPNRRQKKS